MKEERNQIKINNPDGFDQGGYGECRRRFNNDSSGFIREHSLTGVEESAKPKEHFNATETRGGRGRRHAADNGPKKPTGANAQTGGAAAPQGGTDSPAAALSSPGASSQAGAVVTNSVAAAVGGGVTAFTGVVAATVVTAVLVVTTFLAVLGVNLSLVMADYTSLTFRLELVTEGEGELEDPYYEASISGNGVSQSLTVMAGELFTFENLEPDKEYLVTIKNGEGEVQVEQSFCTAAKPIEKGTLTVSISDAEVSVFVQGVPLKSSEFYTVTAKNEKGDVLFVADDVAQEKTFTFRLNSPAKVSVTLSVGGKVQAISETEWGGTPEPKPEPEPEPVPPDYDFENATWQWAVDYTAALTVADKNGGDSLVLPATVQRTQTEAYCLKNSFFVYTATVTRDETEFQDVKYVEIENSALGHICIFEYFDWEPVVPSDGDVNLSDAHGPIGASSDQPADYYTAVAHCTCERCGSTVIVKDGVEVEMDMEGASCEIDAVRYFTATFVNGGETYTDTIDVVLFGTALSHEYVFDRFIWEPVCSSGNVAGSDQTIVGYTAVARFVCSNESSHVLTLSEDVEITYLDTPAGCEEDAYRTFTALVTYEGRSYSDTKKQVFEETAHGHDYSEVSQNFDWGTGEDGSATASIRAYCAYGCGSYDSIAAEVYMEGDSPDLCEEGADVTYFAYVLYRDNFYEEQKEVENVVLGHDYGAPIFEWTPDAANYYATAYFVCSRCLDHTVTIQSSQALSQSLSDGGRIYTVTVTFNDRTYWGRKETHPSQGTSKAPAVGVSYRVGDHIRLDNSAYFKEGDDSADAVTVVDYRGTTVFLTFDITLEEDYSITVKDYQTGNVTQSLYLWENGARNGNVSGWSVWFSEIYQGDTVRAPVGITIVSGSGTAVDPFVLAPLYGKTVTFDYGNGESSTLYFTEDEVEEGVYAVPPTNDPKSPGYIFNGWMLDGAPYDFGEEVTDNLTLTPLWALVAETVRVYFMVDGDLYEMQEFIKGNCAVSPVDPEREHCTVAGWYVDDDTVLFDFETPVEEDIVLYVKWEPEP